MCILNKFVWRHAGFTMAEVLVTVAILAILIGVAIPNVISTHKNLEMAELDATARIIFVAAQDNLTGVRGGSMLNKLASANQTDPTVPKVLYLTDGSALMTTLLPFGAVEPTVAAHHYLIRFNAEYGTVLEVFYSEDALPAAATLFAMGGSSDTARQDRWKAGVGYYAGGDVTVDATERLPAPTVTVDNGETLTVTVTVPNAAETLSRATLYLNVRPADGTVPAVSTPLTLGGLVSGTVAVTLDSLKNGEQFKMLYPGFTPGCDLLVSAGLTPIPSAGTDGKIYLGASSAEATVNSLFAGREMRDGADTVLVANSRHLQNLRTDFSGVDGAVTAAVQTTAISWNDDYQLHPIENPTLTRYDGVSLPITGLVVAGAGHVGLFGSLSAVGAEGITLRNITLVNAKIGLGTESKGILAGNASRVAVENCGAYVSVLKDIGSGTYTYDYAQYAGYGMDSSAKYTGGLIGSASDCIVIDSFAALPFITVTSTHNSSAVGGLIGSASKCTISRSYGAAGQLAGDAGYSGMLIGWTDRNTTISDSYAVGNIRASGQLGTLLSGFLCGGGAAKNSYCAVTYLDKFGSNRTVPRYGFTSGGTAENCAFLDTGSDTKRGDGASAISYDKLKDWGSLRAGWGRPSAKASYPYDEDLEGRTYPFSTPLKNGVAAAHWGSWPLSAVNLVLTYYEVYTDGTWGFYAPKIKDFAAVDTLQNEVAEPDITAVLDGYALLSSTELSTPPSITYQVTAKQRASADCKLSSKSPVELNGKKYFVYLLPPAALQTTYVDGTAVWQKFYCGGEAYWYEPHFAKAVAVSEDGETPAVSTALQVRTARQLYNLGLFSALWDKVFVQQLDVDCTTYQWNVYGLGSSAPIFSPVGNVDRAFTGGYNGGGSTIRGATLGTSGAFCGLFGRLGEGGRVRNVALMPEGTAVPTGMGAVVGLLVAENRGSITSSTVTLPENLSAGGAAFGGCVGRSVGTVEDCMVFGGATGSTVTGTRTVAGFAVESSGTVKRCAVRPNGALGYDGLTLTSQSEAVGFVGALNGGTVEQSWCAATVKATDNGSQAAGFALSIAPSGKLSECYANCETGAGGRAAGFALDLNGNVKHCYALLDVHSSSGAASGFADMVGGQVSASYAVASAKGITSYGFARSAGNGTVKDCRYLKGGYTGTQPGIAMEYGRLTAADCFGADVAWTDENTGRTHPFNAKLKDYPFPRLVSLDHVGDWPEESVDAVGLVYYERYSDGSYGYYGLDKVEVQANALKGNDYEIVETGYGFLLPEEEAAPQVSCNNNTPSTIAETYLATVPAPGGKLLHPFSERAVTALKGGYNWVTIQIATKPSANNYYKFENYRCVNFGFAAAITAEGKSDTMGTAEVPLQIRTQNQLSHIGIDTTLPYFRQTHDINIVGTWTPIKGRDGGKRIIDGYGNKIIGMPQPLFESIHQSSTLTNLWLTEAKVVATGSSASGILINSASSGITVTNCKITDSSIRGQKVGGMFGSVESTPTEISNCFVENVTVTSDAAGGVAAGFAVSISGNSLSSSKILNCHVSPSTVNGQYGKVVIQTMRENSLAAGFAGTINSAPITNSYAVAMVSAPHGQAAGFAGILTDGGKLFSSYSNCVTSGADAAGFVLTPKGGAMSGCYALLSVTGTNTAYGFCGSPDGSSNISSSYSAASVTGNGTVYGFSPSYDRLSDCYYLSGDGSGGGSKQSYSALAGLADTLGTAWTTPTANRTHTYSMPAEGCYPFPMLKAVDHYGDWPLSGGDGAL